MKGMNKFYRRLGWKSFYPNVSGAYNIVGAISFLGGLASIVSGIIDKDEFRVGVGGVSTFFGYQMLFNKNKITKLAYNKDSDDSGLPWETLLMP